MSVLNSVFKFNNFIEKNFGKYLAFLDKFAFLFYLLFFVFNQ